MSQSFDDAFRKLLGNEGGYVDNPADPGGATIWGVAERVARANGYDGPMKDMPQAEARRIAFAQYWQPYQLDALDARLAFQVFDAIYNSGVGAIRWLQAALGVQADGIVGPLTLQAARKCNVSQIIARFDAHRLLFLASLPAWPDFSRGWARRIAVNLLTGEA